MFCLYLMIEGTGEKKDGKVHILQGITPGSVDTSCVPRAYLQVPVTYSNV